MALGYLRALPAPCTNGARTLDHPVGCGRLERYAAPLGPVQGMRRQGRNHPNPRLGWTTDSGARMAESRHLGAANLCLPAPKAITISGGAHCSCRTKV